jgi:uncharacterized cupredoxin-like copper-binding protein
MKKAVFSMILSFSVLMLTASNGFKVTYTQPREGTHQLVYTIDNYTVNGVTLQGVEYSRINFEGKVVTQKKGYAELPYLNATVMIDPVKNVSIEIIPGSYEDIALAYPLVPSRGVIYRNQDPSTVPYMIDPRSVTDAWYPVNLAENTDPFILRDIRGTSVYVYPFQYNAVRGILRVYKSITVRLVENNTFSLNPLPKAPTSIVREMDGIYRSVFINYASLNRDNLTIGEFGDIHVIVTSRDEAAIQPYIQWKKEKGYQVSEEVVPTGTNINANVQAAYDNNNNILYVLLVGDWADLQCNLSGGGRPMDPQVGDVVGNDQFADIAVGRFSANSPADVTVQVNKVINYEKLPDMGGTWYSSAIGVGSDQGPGDDGEYDYQHENVILNNKLDPFTYETMTTIYDPGATADMVTTAVNAGASVVNYTGHGWMDGWGTTGYSSTNVATLTNGSKLPFIVSVACDNGDFDLGTCYAESWLRKENGGAIMFLGASISQPWNEPMRGQDYFMDVLIGGYDYSAHPGQSGISTTEQRTTLGAMIFNGFTLMCTESGGPSDFETASTWNLFGDPALQARTATPAALTLSNYNIMVGIPFTTIVTTSGTPVENAMVTLSQGDLFFTGITDVAGSVTIEQTLTPGTAKLVVTGFNTGTIYQDETVIPPNGAYITVSSVTIDDAAGNGNGLLDYGETAFLTISLSNLGSADATDVSAQITTEDDYIGISNASASYGNIPAGQTVTITDGFTINAFENIPDQHVAMFGLMATGTTVREIWTSNFAIPGHAPVLEMAEYSIDDSGGNNNGRLDPGETAALLVTTQNAGSADAYNVIGSLSSESEYITVNNSPLAYGDLTAGTSSVQSFEVTVDAAAPVGQAAAFDFDISADMNISDHAEFSQYIGQIPVLLLDWDPNHNSPDSIVVCLNNLQVGFDMTETMPADRNLYASIFVCLGTYAENRVLTADEGQILADYLNQGGNLYMEGADTWYYDQMSTPTPVHPMFNITGLEDGAGDLVQLNGQPGTIADGMSYLFSGDNAYIDHLDAIPPAQVMFMNSSPEYNACVSYDAGTYRTIGSSFEFGGLQDGEKTKDDLMIQMLEFFNIQGVWTGVKDNQPGASVIASCYPNPFREETVIRFESKDQGRVSLEVYNINGQLVNRLLDGVIAAGVHEVHWDGSNSSGIRVAEGMYFYRLQAGNDVVSGKLMMMR